MRFLSTRFRMIDRELIELCLPQFSPDVRVNFVIEKIYNSRLIFLSIDFPPKRRIKSYGRIPIVSRFITPRGSHVSEVITLKGSSS